MADVEGAVSWKLQTWMLGGSEVVGRQGGGED